MLSKEEKYVLAMATLLLIGLSTAWAGYSGTSTISVEGLSDFASITSSKPSITLKNLKINQWFYNKTQGVFNITVNTGVWVRVGVLNMAELADDFKALDINVTLMAGDSKVDSDVISLGAGVSSVLLNASSVTSGSLSVDLYISGRPVKSNPDPIKLYCAVEPASGVTQP
jgi:hypothetical protein